ncbi:hypothetical protein IPC1502_30885, partial [Pseudomonas aeruginosa]
MSRFRPINREIDYLLPPSVQDWLPESHLARYVVEVVEGLDLSKGAGLAARVTFGALRGGGRRGPGSVEAGERLCGPWQRCLPSGYVAV